MSSKNNTKSLVKINFGKNHQAWRDLPDLYHYYSRRRRLIHLRWLACIAAAGMIFLLSPLIREYISHILSK
jgi:hypothetical protein